MMITINLLPESFRRPKESSVQQFPRSPLAVVIIGGLVLMLVGLGTMWQLHQASLAKLRGRLQSLHAQKQAVDELRASLVKLRDEDQAFEELNRQRLRWARMLNILSDVMPEKVWLTDLSYDQRGLVVQGSALAESGQEMVRIGRFVQDLKASPEVSAIIQDIQIESIKTVQDHQIEIVEFTLSCKLTGQVHAS